MNHELIYDWTDDEDRHWQLVYDVEPYSRGGRDEPPSGGSATVTEIRGPSGLVLPPGWWTALGFSGERLAALEEACYEQWREERQSAAEDAAEARAGKWRQRWRDDA
jgi:hypothetical protein